MTEIYKRLRPKRLEDIIGQPEAVAQLQRLIKKGLPRTLLLSGPSGTGKTTIARILRRMLGCDNIDYNEIDCASVEKPIDTVRQLRRNMGLAPVGGKCRIWFLEEIQAWSKAGFSQQAMLKLLEDTPEHCYFFLATTDAQKLIRTIHTRATEIKLRALSRNDLGTLLKNVMESEKLEVDSDALEEIINVCDGSARKALVLLEQISDLPAKEQADAVSGYAADKDAAVNLARALINPRASWPEVAAILKELTEEPESIRYCVLGYARSVLLGGKQLAPRAFVIIDVFSTNFYDSKHAGLAAACWEVIQSGR